MKLWRKVAKRWHYYPEGSRVSLCGVAGKEPYSPHETPPKFRACKCCERVKARIDSTPGV